MLALLILLTGCTYHTTKTVDTDGTGDDELDCLDCGWDADDAAWYECGDGPTGETDTDSEEPASLWLEPDTVDAGTTHIVSVLSATPAPANATGLTFVGDIDVIALSVRSDTEVLVTIAVDQAAAPGRIDVIVDYADGSAALIHEGLRVKAADE